MQSLWGIIETLQYKMGYAQNLTTLRDTYEKMPQDTPQQKKKKQQFLENFYLESLQQGSLENIQFAIAEGVDVNYWISWPYGMFASDLVVKAQHPLIYAIEQLAKTQQPDAQKKWFNIVAYLAKQPKMNTNQEIDDFVPEKKGIVSKTPLSISLSYHLVEVARVLLANRADPFKVPTRKGVYPLCQATATEQETLVLLVLDAEIAWIKEHGKPHVAPKTETDLQQALKIAKPGSKIAALLKEKEVQILQAETEYKKQQEERKRQTEADIKQTEEKRRQEAATANQKGSPTILRHPVPNKEASAVNSPVAEKTTQAATTIKAKL